MVRVFLSVLPFAVTPKLLPFTFGEEPLNSGQVVTVPCAVIEGDSPLKLRWTLNGHGISPHSGIAILDLGGRGAILSIQSVQASHAGIYTCVAENLAGRHELSADLVVNGVAKKKIYFCQLDFIDSCDSRFIIIRQRVFFILQFAI